MSRDFPAAPIVLAGDVNQLSDEDLVERTGMTQIVHQPTRGANILDRVLRPAAVHHRPCRVVASVVKSDHKAFVIYADKSQIECAQLKTRNSAIADKPARRVYRSVKVIVPFHMLDIVSNCAIVTLSLSFTIFHFKNVVTLKSGSEVT